VTAVALPRAARLHAAAGHERHSCGELSPPWLSAPFGINILLFTTEVKQCIPFSPPCDCSYELKITFCVRGVVSPLLANLFLHYALDRWMAEHYPQAPFERYADDAIVHCRKEVQAQEIRKAIAARLTACGLELHPGKTKVVYCKDDLRRRTYPNEKFDFLGYTFRPRRSKNREGKHFINFSPAVSDQAVKAIRAEIRSWD